MDSGGWVAGPLLSTSLRYGVQSLGLGQDVAHGLDGSVAPAYLLNAFALDDRVFDQKIVVDLATIEIAGAFDGYPLANAHRMIVATGHDYAGLDPALRSDL